MKYTHLSLLTVLALCLGTGKLAAADPVNPTPTVSSMRSSLLGNPTNNTAVATNTAANSNLATTNAPGMYTAGGWGKKLKQGGNTAIIQILISMFGAGFIFERFSRCRRKHIVPEGLSDRARELWKAGKYAELEALGEKEPSILARGISFVVRHRQNSAADVSALAGEFVSRELSLHHQKAYPLGVVATLEPLLGLLGMILGMIETFETVALAGSLGDPTALASGIAEALVTTGLGLATAIPFLALYHYFKSKTNGFATILEEEMTDLITEWLMTKEKEGKNAR
ncbi:MAG: MotA/TolQ/ExbB proton channel family protein [Verrucomicrobiota bacterium]